MRPHRHRATTATMSRPSRHVMTGNPWSRNRPSPTRHPCHQNAVDHPHPSAARRECLRAGSDRLMRFLAYLWEVAAPYAFTGLVDIDEARHDHEQMMDLFEARDVDGIIDLMARHRGQAVEAVARWEARSRS